MTTTVWPETILWYYYLEKEYVDFLEVGWSLQMRIANYLIYLLNPAKQLVSISTLKNNSVNILFIVSTDLSKRRYLLLTKANGLIKGNSYIKYVYSDINCSLALRFNEDSFKYFNSENSERELLRLLNV